MYPSQEKKKEKKESTFPSTAGADLSPSLQGGIKFQNQSLAGAKLNPKCKWLWRSNILQALYHFNQAKSRHWQSREALEIQNSPNVSPNLD